MFDSFFPRQTSRIPNSWNTGRLELSFLPGKCQGWKIKPPEKRCLKTYCCFCRGQEISRKLPILGGNQTIQIYNNFEKVRVGNIMTTVLGDMGSFIYHSTWRVSSWSIKTIPWEFIKIYFPNVTPPPGDQGQFLRDPGIMAMKSPLKKGVEFVGRNWQPWGGPEGPLDSI